MIEEIKYTLLKIVTLKKMFLTIISFLKLNLFGCNVKKRNAGFYFGRTIKYV
jgi:hypothetical protein